MHAPVSPDRVIGRAVQRCGLQPDLAQEVEGQPGRAGRGKPAQEKADPGAGVAQSARRVARPRRQPEAGRVAWGNRPNTQSSFILFSSYLLRCSIFS
jgi:hypothetical protein